MKSMEEAKGKEASVTKKLGIGCLVVVGGLFTLSVIGAALESPEDRAAREELEKAAKVEEEAELLARSKVAAVAWYNEIIDIAGPCDQQSNALQEQFAGFGSSSNLYSIYATASQTRNVCEDSWTAYRKLDVPNSFASDAEEKAEEAHDTCGNAYFAKRQFADLAMEISDGDMRPSKIEEAKEYGEAGSAGVLLCVAQAMSAASLAGADLEELGEAE